MTGALDGIVRLWDPATLEWRGALEGHAHGARVPLERSAPLERGRVPETDDPVERPGHEQPRGPRHRDDGRLVSREHALGLLASRVEEAHLATLATHGETRAVRAPRDPVGRRPLGLEHADELSRCRIPETHGAIGGESRDELVSGRERDLGDGARVPG